MFVREIYVVKHKYSEAQQNMVINKKKIVQLTRRTVVSQVKTQ